MHNSYWPDDDTSEQWYKFVLTVYQTLKSESKVLMLEIPYIYQVTELAKFQGLGT